MTLSCQNQSLDIKTSSQRCLPMTSDDSNSLQSHSKVLTFQILFSFRAVKISEITQSFSPNPRSQRTEAGLSCQNQKLDIKTSSQRCLPMTSNDSNSLKIHSKDLTFQILFSFRAVNISENGPSFSANPASVEVSGDPILSKSITRHQDQFVEVSTNDLK